MRVMQFIPASATSTTSSNLGIKELDAELFMLQSNNFRINDLVRKTRREKYLHIGDIYIWWTNAKQETNYLKDCYAAANIIVDSSKVSTDFRSIMKLICKNQMPERDLSEWVACLEFVHNEVKDSPDDFANNPIDAIADRINSKGGISGIANTKSKTSAKSVPAKEAANDDCFTLVEEELNSFLIEEAKMLHDQNTNLPVINTPGLPLNEHGYGVAVVKQNQSNFVFVGTVNDPTYIRQGMLHTYRSDFEALPQSVRAVIEPLHILNEPQIVSRYRRKFIDKSIVATNGNAAEKAPPARRLIYRASEGHFLLSTVGVDASPVVISTPRQQVITGATADLYLPLKTREEIETKLLDSKSFNLFEASNDSEFSHHVGNFGDSFSVSLRTKLKIGDSDGVRASTIERHTSNLNHSKITFKPFFKFLGESHQVDSLSRYFTPSWSCSADMAFINKLNHQFFFSWIEKLGKYARRKEHKTFSLHLEDKNLQIGFEKGKNGYDQHESFALMGSTANGVATLEVRSTDLAFIFRQILDLKVVGKINIAANSNAIRIQFKTSANVFECWIPAVDVNGVRQAISFAPYIPIQSPTPKAPSHVPDAVDPEDLGPDDGTEFDMDEIAAAINKKSR